jgi:hypothetical protein
LLGIHCIPAILSDVINNIIKTQSNAKS